MTISKEILNYLEKYSDKPRKLEKFSVFIENFFNNMNEEDQLLINAFEEEMENFLYEIDEECLEKIIITFKTKENEITGMKWKLDDVLEVEKQFNVENKITSLGKDFNSLHFWALMNYVYAVHNNPTRSLSAYVDLAIDEYCNKNVCYKNLINHLITNTDNTKN